MLCKVMRTSDDAQTFCRPASKMQRSFYASHSLNFIIGKLHNDFKPKSVALQMRVGDQSNVGGALIVALICCFCCIAGPLIACMFRFLFLLFGTNLMHCRCDMVDCSCDYVELCVQRAMCSRLKYMAILIGRCYHSAYCGFNCICNQFCFQRNCWIFASNSIVNDFIYGCLGCSSLGKHV